MINKPRKWPPAPGVSQETSDRVHAEQLASWEERQRLNAPRHDNLGANALIWSIVIVWVLLVVFLYELCGAWERTQ